MPLPSQSLPDSLNTGPDFQEGCPVECSQNRTSYRCFGSQTVGTKERKVLG